MNFMALKTTDTGLPPDLIQALSIYNAAGIQITDEARRETESDEYGACRFSLNNHNIAFRVAKTTPTKIGQFVTIWKRLAKKIVPLDNQDGINFVVISVSDATHQGQFIFDRATLVAQGIMSNKGKGGKLALRVYPPWTKPVAKIAIKTQNWQLPYFLPIPQDGVIATMKIRELFRLSPR